MYRIYKEDSDGIELLPDVIDTPIWKGENVMKPGTKNYLAYVLYQAIQKRENHYQINTPPAFGDPYFARYEGIVHGILLASGMEEALETTSKGKLIVIKKGNRKFLVIDKVKRSSFFCEMMKENQKLLKEVGL